MVALAFVLAAFTAALVGLVSVAMTERDVPCGR